MNIEVKNKEKIDLYLKMIQEKNKMMNLTAVDDYDEMWDKHVIDSLTVMPLIEKYGTKKIIDIGTGAGFPGMIIKIEGESLDIVLMDSLKKRMNFLDEVIDALDLKQIKTIHARAEDLAQKEHREIYDAAISRAVARLDTLAEYALPFVKVGGYFFAMKGPAIDEEVKEASNAINILGGKIVENIKYDFEYGERNILVIKKIKTTPKKYPRGQNKPRLKPL